LNLDRAGCNGFPQKPFSADDADERRLETLTVILKTDAQQAVIPAKAGIFFL
jgi:hypothetical protein